MNRDLPRLNRITDAEPSNQAASTASTSLRRPPYVKSEPIYWFLEEWTDEDLLLLLQSKMDEGHVFRALHKRYGEWARARACIYVDASDAPDIAQDALLYLWRKAPFLKLPCQLECLLSKVIRHMGLNFQTKKNRCRLYSPTELEFLESEIIVTKTITNIVEDDVEKREFWRCLRNCLTPFEFRILVMRFWEEMTYRQVSEIEGIPIWTIKRRVREVLQKLKKSERFLLSWGG